MKFLFGFLGSALLAPSSEGQFDGLFKGLEGFDFNVGDLFDAPDRAVGMSDDDKGGKAYDAGLSKEQKVAAATYKPRTRKIYLQIEQVEWNFAPQGRNEILDTAFGDDENVFLQNRPLENPFNPNQMDPPVTDLAVGSRYQKFRYIEYTDDTFTTQVPRRTEELHLGLLGPVVRCVVGDTVHVTLKNGVPADMMNNQRRRRRLQEGGFAGFDQPPPLCFSAHPHGLAYTKMSEGAFYSDGSGDPNVDGTPGIAPADCVMPGMTATQEWFCVPEAGPGPKSKVSSMSWVYHSHVNTPLDINSGIYGMIVVTAPWAVKTEENAARGTPGDVDREFFALMHVVNENAGWLIEENVEQYIIGDVALTDPERDMVVEFLDNSASFPESNLMHAINGLMYGNVVAEDTLPLFKARQGEKVRWYVTSMGSEEDHHTHHWHGNVLTTERGLNRDVILMSAAESMPADMYTRNAGNWLYHCHIHDHISAGMESIYQVLQTEAVAVPPPGKMQYSTNPWYKDDPSYAGKF
uniref:Plastocyanin-like domain-containing protein n=1 Tax=Chromera velia CCMP2878 TaxID=1169474 RepID=A0A0G4GQ79_9ALVE|mmetsp:Transcript_49802/g.98156  ORF Transcript_49802/g.98156 Transcript_49802/m.98156 type:complete len:520 (+) Transcript_49802:136-1695(+)|eukprot:Cvel_5020.t1-p1 / transcript=Cvel_5020.t1 / gene=Cvel_5020 / organism=Chromera_velia_CCMP2878 / gene_product=Hephaestin-like protein 1, putative / transcript_product=Hephaestin-like protein 1, putative / location=Cvel_scaffold228:39606-42704(+) / protein_length=519 / sequence_SO=supercontig / SO=protein_coding / is_pseudo=false